MKNVMIAIALLFSLSLAAQGGPRGKHGKRMAQTDLSIEQRAILQSKKMTLMLDLSSGQQKKVEKILVDQFQSKKEMQSRRKTMSDSLAVPDPDQRFEQMNARLEAQIAFQNRMKEVLSEEQYSIWKQAQGRKHRAKGQRGARR